MTDAEKILALLDEVSLPMGSCTQNLDALGAIRAIAQAEVDAQLEAVASLEPGDPLWTQTELDDLYARQDAVWKTVGGT